MNRIEPWREPPASIFPVYGPGRGTIKGTELHYDGATLRAHGGYSGGDDRPRVDVAAALLSAINHAEIEGIDI